MAYRIGWFKILILAILLAPAPALAFWMFIFGLFGLLEKEPFLSIAKILGAFTIFQITAMMVFLIVAMVVVGFRKLRRRLRM